jgi:dipeptidyl aminopeptidase/acylaminoacyl peptidase
MMTFMDAGTRTAGPRTAGPFSLDVYNAIPRVNGLLLSPDGRRLVLSVQVLSPDAKKFVTSLWELPADGSAEPRRLTYSDKGEGGAAFLPDSSLVFSSARPDPTVKEDEGRGRVWRLPAGTGEAQPLLSVPGGVHGIVAARDATAVALSIPRFPSASNLEEDADKATRRKDAGTTAILFERYPIRYWDHDLGPRAPRLARWDLDPGTPLEDVAPDAVDELLEASVALSPDGRTVVTTWNRPTGLGFMETDLVAIERGGGARRAIATGGADFGSPAVSPDGRWVVAVRERRGTPELALDVTLWLIDLASGEGRDLTPSLDLWPSSPVWAPDSGAVYFSAAERGHGPVFRVELDGGAVQRLTEEGAYTSVCPAPDGTALFALRSSYAGIPEVVRIGLDDRGVRALPTPGAPVDLPGVLEEVTATADDGAPLRAWLVRPKDASAEEPAPMVLWIHGGPLSSWNSWSWRWCPHLMVERGYAVLLPDPALSTGYGHAFVQRGWGSWGERPFTDLMAITDEALKRPDLDAGRTAAMGGSFGGYMSNWVAGHTDRFRAIVTHASLWAMDQFHATTDMGTFWEDQLGDPYRDGSRWLENSPNRHVSSIRTPMLVIHGKQDYRVPVGEALRLWTDLQRHGVPSKFLYFTDENHWVLKPGNAKVWYETVLAFLDHHVLGREWKRPDLV